MTPAIEIARTPFRSWAVLLLFRGQQSSAVLVSYTFGLFLPFIREDLNISSLEAGLLQGVWWISWALLSLPFGVRLSRFRPVPLILVSLILGAPFLFLQALAFNFWMLLLARLFFISTHVMNTPARALLLHQWVAPRHYAKVLSLGLSQHSVMLAMAVSLSPLLIEGLGSWRLLYLIMGGLFVLQIVAWRVVARGRESPTPTSTARPGRSSRVAAAGATAISAGMVGGIHDAVPLGHLDRHGDVPAHVVVGRTGRSLDTERAVAGIPVLRANTIGIFRRDVGRQAIEPQAASGGAGLAERGVCLGHHAVGRAAAAHGFDHRVGADMDSHPGD